MDFRPVAVRFRAQLDRDNLRNDIQKLEEMLKEERDLNELERQEAEEEAKKKQELPKLASSTSCIQG